jgi:hypothetical protein
LPKSRSARESETGGARRGVRATLSLVSFDPGTLIAGFLVSGIGFVLFSYGRKQGRIPHVVFGLVLMVFPYFVPGVLLMLGIAAVLCGLLYVATRAGY